MKDNGKTPKNSTVKHMTLRERLLTPKREKIRVFEDDLDKILGFLQDDPAKLLMNGKFLENYKVTYDDALTKSKKLGSQLYLRSDKVST